MSTDLAPTPTFHRRLDAIDVDVARSLPAEAAAVGLPVGPSGSVPRQLGLDRARITALGFEGKVGQTLVVPHGDRPTAIAVGVGEADELDVAALRDAAAAFARAADQHAHLATTLTTLAGIPADVAAQAVTEGVLLASYRYLALKRDPKQVPRIERLTLVAGADRAAKVAAGADRGRAAVAAVGLARDLANSPPGHLTATAMAEAASSVAAACGLGVEVFDEDALRQLGCGGLLGVNAGSAEPPRMVRLTYRPRRPKGHVALVGKGVMYDSGGISLKPSDPMHAIMKMDMSGAAAVLASMSALASVGCRSAVTGYLMCTDNMPSGSAMKLGDVLTIHGGTSVEIHNTDAEGRLILADGLALATEDQPDRPDAVVDIATLTGACMVALGPSVAGLLGNNQSWIEQVKDAALATDEPVWQLPLETKRYRKLLDSDVADLKNVGGPYGGAITAAIFLSQFVGDVPWVHLDIAGPMNAGLDESWRTKGATGFGTRLLLELAARFTPPSAA
jgi:leucyl aminopeptidase